MSANAVSANSRAETTGRFSKHGGSYQAVGQQLELEFVPINNFRIEVGTTLAAHNIEPFPASRIAIRSPGKARRSTCAIGSSIARRRPSA